MCEDFPWVLLYSGVVCLWLLAGIGVRLCFIVILLGSVWLGCLFSGGCFYLRSLGVGHAIVEFLVRLYIELLEHGWSLELTHVSLVVSKLCNFLPEENLMRYLFFY